MSLPISITSLYERLLAAWRERAVALKAVSFALVGLVNTAVDAAVFFLLLGFVTSSLVIANVTGGFAGDNGPLVMNSLATFSARNRGGRARQQVAGALFVPAVPGDPI